MFHFSFVDSPTQVFGFREVFLPYLVKRKMALALANSHALNHALGSVNLRVKSAGHRIVGPSTKLVIEGPPRCGNSSALRLVTRNNPSFRRHVATHIHRPFQIRYAMKYGVPAVVMLRNPNSSTISHASLLCQLGQVQVETDRKREKLLLLCVEEYIAFVRDIQDVGFRYIVKFEEYVKAPDRLIEYLNNVHHLGLSCGNSEQEGVEAVHVFPSEQRDTLKETFSRVAADSPQIRQLLQAATQFYDALISARVLPDGQ